MIGQIKGSKRSNVRRFKGKGPRPDRSEYKREEARERNEAWRKLTPQEQLNVLDARVGPDGAKRQRERIIASMIRKAKHPKEAQLAQEKPQKAKERHAQERAKRPSK